LDAGWRALVHAVGVVPWWLENPRGPLERMADLSASPSAAAIGSSLLVVGVLVALTILGWRRRRTDVWAACAVGLALCAALVAAAAAVPQSSFASVGYGLRWASPAGMSIWLLVGWSLAMIAARRFALTPARRPVLAVIGLGVAIATSIVVAVTADPVDEPYRQMRLIADRVKTELPTTTGSVRVSSAFSGDTYFMAFDLEAGTVYALRREGRNVSAPALAGWLGSRYGAAPFDSAVRVNVDTSPPSRGRTVVRASAREPFAPQLPIRRISVTVLSAATRR
jgi:hypothetical protein